MQVRVENRCETILNGEWWKCKDHKGNVRKCFLVEPTPQLPVEPRISYIGPPTRIRITYRSPSDVINMRYLIKWILLWMLPQWWLWTFFHLECVVVSLPGHDAQTHGHMKCLVRLFDVHWSIHTVFLHSSIALWRRNFLSRDMREMFTKVYISEIALLRSLCLNKVPHKTLWHDHWH